jgi:hypothetical protein
MMAVFAADWAATPSGKKAAKKSVKGRKPSRKHAAEAGAILAVAV